MINETLRKLRNAASTGKSCGGCGRDFQPNEPVWRIRHNTGLGFSAAQQSSRRSVSSACCHVIGPPVHPTRAKDVAARCATQNGVIAGISTALRLAPRDARCADTLPLPEIGVPKLADERAFVRNAARRSSPRALIPGSARASANSGHTASVLRLVKTTGVTFLRAVTQTDVSQMPQRRPLTRVPAAWWADEGESEKAHG